MDREITVEAIVYYLNQFDDKKLRRILALISGMLHIQSEEAPAK